MDEPKDELIEKEGEYQEFIRNYKNSVRRLIKMNKIYKDIEEENKENLKQKKHCLSFI